MKTALPQGRDFTDRDDTNSAPVVIVDKTFVKNFNLGDRVIGRRIDSGEGVRNAKIIGLVDDIKRTGMADGARGEMYVPYRQTCWGVLTLVVRTQRDPAEMTRAIRSELDTLDKDLPLENVSTLSQLVAANVAQRRLSVQLLGGFASGALLLAALGLYGVLAHTVAQRKRDVLSLVVRQGMRLALAGVLIRVVAACALSQVLTRLLFQIKPLDPLTFATGPLVLASVALLACWLPARRAARVDPMEALRQE